jgi:hypothetical protein
MPSNSAAESQQQERIVLRSLLRSITATEPSYQRLIVATAADSSYVAFALNWHDSVTKAGVRRPLVLCLDDELGGWLEPHGITTYASTHLKLPPAVGVRRYGTLDFAHAAKLKLMLQSAVLSAGFDLLFTDVDAPWAADLRPYLMRAGSKAPLLVQVNFPSVYEHNSGVFFARATAEVHQFFELAVATCSSTQRSFELGAYGSDQRCSNFALHCGDPQTGEVPGVDGKCMQSTRRCNWRCEGKTNPCLQLAARQLWQLNASHVATHRLGATRYFLSQCRTMRLDYGLLPPALFRTGGCSPPISSAVSELCAATTDSWRQRRPLLVHANWVVGVAEKHAKLAAAGLWKPFSSSEKCTIARVQLNQSARSENRLGASSWVPMEVISAARNLRSTAATQDAIRQQRILTSIMSQSCRPQDAPLIKSDPIAQSVPVAAAAAEAAAKRAARLVDLFNDIDRRERGVAIRRADCRKLRSKQAETRCSALNPGLARVDKIKQKIESLAFDSMFDASILT